MTKKGLNLHLVQDVVYIILGALIAGFGLMGFLVPNGFLDGGVTGISLLLHEFYNLPLSLVVIIANIPFFIMGSCLINKSFTWKTILSVIILGLLLQFFPYPQIASDWGSKILIAIFGGFFLGIGIGLGMRGGCALDGIEVLALYTLRRVGLTMSEIILGLNAIIFLIAAWGFGSEKAFFAMLTYYVATKTIDYVVEGIEEYTGVTIVSNNSELIKQKLAKELGRGITVYKGERGFMKDSFHLSHECDIIFTIITRLEVRRLRKVIHILDPKAFVFTNTIKEAAGGILKRHSSH